MAKSFSNQYRKIDIEICRQTAKVRNGSCLSVEYVNNASLMKWRCEKGHEWLACWSNIYKGQWCPQCARERINKTLKARKVGIAICRKNAIEKGGECLSSIYQNNSIKLHWRCQMGHEWIASWQSIRQGHWCPMCGIDKMWVKRRENANRRKR
jgi:hypothetical protein